MSDALLDRIHTDPNVMVGKPVIRGTRLTVDFVIGLLAHGATVEDVLDEYARLEREDIQACLLFAQRTLADASFVPLAA
ncbi:MAG: DUF433 domain-containing protein [Bacteroidota bacterium]